MIALRPVARARPSLVGLDLFWIWALGLLLLTSVELSKLLVRNPGKRLDAWAWVVVGLGLPVVSIWFARYLRRRAVLARALGSLAVFFLVGYLGVFLPQSKDLLVLVFGGLECLLFFGPMQVRASVETQRFRGKLLFALVVLFTWAGALGLVWWTSPYQELVGSPWAISVTATTGVLVFSAFWTHSLRRLAGSTYHRCLLGATAVAMFFGSFYPVDLTRLGIYHHWSFYIGSAQLVREGGALLWNVPSQYGFFSILLLAHMPMRSLWDALYLLNASANLVMALSFVGLVWVILSSFLQRVALSLLVFCVMFLRSGLDAVYTGTNYYPSTGGYRFMWLAVVMFLFLWGTHRYTVATLPRWLLYLTPLIWVISILWSAESMFYTSIVFIPGFLAVALARKNDAPRRRLVLAAAPYGMFVIALIVIVAGYQAGIGRLPDPYLYVQYLLAYNAGFGSLPIDFFGPAWILFLVGVVVSAVAVANRIFKLSVEERISLLVLALGAFGTASYFIASRSHPNNLINISLFMCLPLFFIYALANERMPSHYLNDLVKLITPVLVVVLIAASLADATALNQYVHPAALPPWRTLDQPSAGPSLQQLLDRAAVGPDDRIILLSDATGTTLMPPWRFAGTGRVVGDSAPWLPVAPLAQISLLSPADRQAYLERSGQMHRIGGWLIAARGSGNPVWLLRYIDAHYVPVRSLADQDWEATLYSPVDSSR